MDCLHSVQYFRRSNFIPKQKTTTKQFNVIKSKDIGVWSLQTYN